MIFIGASTTIAIEDKLTKLSHQEILDILTKATDATDLHRRIRERNTQGMPNKASHAIGAEATPQPER
mgnify:CR=1 FL=1